MPITTIVQAIAEFSRLCPPTVCPILTCQDAVSERQQIVTTGNPSSGAFALTVVNPLTAISAVATGLAYNISAAALQTALETLINVSVGDVTCSGGPLPAPIVVQFSGDFASLAITLMTAMDSFNAGDVTIIRLVAGQPQGDVQEILASHVRGTIWQAVTTYELGARIIPSLTNRNKHRYQLVRYTGIGTDQKSGTTEPAWTTSRDSIVEDGHCVWQEDGDDWDAMLWDFQSAWRDGWIEKAAKSVPATDVSDNQGVSGKWSQIYEHCLKQADKFWPVYVL